jgi:hypothetical protein
MDRLSTRVNAVNPRRFMPFFRELKYASKDFPSSGHRRLECIMVS